MIYLDNAATSFPKPKAVIDAVNSAIETYSGNPGRSGHRLSVLASEKIYETRELIAEHFSYGFPENIVFTYNATYALNLAIRAKIKPFSHVICSDIEHNAVYRPLSLLKKSCNIDFSFFSSNGDIKKNIKNAVRKNTKAIISTLASNVTGKRIPLRLLSEAAKDEGLLLIVDASQSAGHEKIDLTETPCDCLCAPGHKGLFGILGSGFIIFNGNEPLYPFIAGGSGNNSQDSEMPALLPERYEAGSLSTPAICALGEGIRFIEKVGLNVIAEREHNLTERLKSGLSVISDIDLYETEGSIVLFNHKNISEYILSNLLDKYGICVRGGLHCAPLAHRKLGTENKGAVRLSVSYFNTQNEIEYFLKTLTKILAEI